MSNPSNPKMMLPRDVRTSVSTSPGNPQSGETPPNPRKLREKVMMALIMTSTTAVGAERAPTLVAEAGRVVAYIMDGEAA